jgi:ribose transport system permease protein
MVKSNIPIEAAMFIAILLAIAIGAAIGFINGFMVGKLKIPAFIATLGTMLIFRSLGQFMCPTATGGTSASTYKIYQTQTITNPWYNLGNSSIPGIEFPWVAIILIALTVLVWLFVKYTKFGRKIYAIGSNSRAAQLAGINAPWSKALIFTIAGGLVGVSVFLHISIRGSVECNSAGSSYELFAIASCIVGAISMAGGKGNIIGILFGALSFTMIDKIISALGLDPLINNTIKGLILLIAVMLQLIQGSTIKELGGRIKSWFIPAKKEKLVGEAVEAKAEEEIKDIEE